MTDVDRDLSLPVAAQSSLSQLVEWSIEAERRRYDRVWMPESWGRDVVTILASVAARTDEVGIGSSIANVYSRSPALLGQTAATLGEASDGRFRLGLGPSGPALIESWHGVDYDRPLRRTREAIEVVRAVLSGEPVEYDGELFDLSGFRLRHDPPATVPPVDAAGMGPTAVELAGRFGDGWHALMLSPEGLRERLAAFRRGAELGNRDPADQRVTVSLTCCALNDGERARQLVRDHLAFYVGSMGDFYHNALAAQGYEDEAEAITGHSQAGDREAAMAAIDDELLDTFAVAGTPSECRERLATFEEIDGVDAVAVSFPRGAGADEIFGTLEYLSP